MQFKGFIVASARLIRKKTNAFSTDTVIYRGCKLHVVLEIDGWHGYIGDNVKFSFPTFGATDKEHMLAMLKSQVDCWFAIGVNPCQE